MDNNESKIIINGGLIQKIIVSCLILFIIGYLGKFIFNKLNKDNGIQGVRKVLSTKYQDISCIDSNCNSIMAIKGDNLSKYKVYIYNNLGNRIAKYKVTYDSESSKEQPIDASNDFFISLKRNNDSNEKEYAIRDKKGKYIYKTKNELSIINDELILMKKNKYSILNKKGEELYNNISIINSYVNGKYIQIKINNSNIIIDNKGNRILEDYVISKILYDEEDNEYGLIINNQTNNSYNFYSIKKDKIVSDSFISYSKNSKNQYIIRKKDKNKIQSYILNKNGKQEIYLSTNLVDEVKKKISSSKYKVYDESIFENQKYVLVDNKIEKSFGLLNIKNNKYEKIFDYKNNNDYYYSNVSRINTYNKKIYLKISCNTNNCDESSTIIYNLTDKKQIYKSTKISIKEYKEYEEGYKIIYFGNENENKYSGKFVIFDNKNNELLIDDNDISILDKKIVVGNITLYSTLLYSVKDKKLINRDVSIISVKDKYLYKYNDKDDNIVVLNSNGEQVIKADNDSLLQLSNNNYIYIDNNYIKIYNILKDKTYKYKLKDNEKLNNAKGDIISPFSNALFINNSIDSYSKVINFKSDLLIKIKGSEISSVKYNYDNNRAYIIVRKSTDSGNMYGLYIAE